MISNTSNPTVVKKKKSELMLHSREVEWCGRVVGEGWERGGSGVGGGAWLGRAGERGGAGRGGAGGCEEGVRRV